MWRVFLAIFSAMALYACETIKVAETPLGKVHSGSFSVGGKSVPLPDGKWIVTGSAIYYSNLDNPFSRTVLVSLDQNSVKGMVYVTTNLRPGFNLGSTGYIKSKRCSRPNVIFSETFENEAQGNQDCWGIAHHAPLKSTSKHEHWKETRLYILNNNISYPKVFVSLFYSFATSNDQLSVYYYRNPELDGMTPPKSVRSSKSDWHVDYISDHPDKLDYVEKLKTWGKAWHPRFKRAFMGLPVAGLPSQRLEDALRSTRPALAKVTPPTPRALKPPAPRALKKTGSGTGFVVSHKGHVLTNRHVISQCRKVRVEGNGHPKRITADKKIDLALLEVDLDGREVSVFRDGRGIRAGDDVIVVGYPLQSVLSTDMNVTKGIVSALAGPGDDRRIMQITAPVQQGNSGGPVLDTSGHVVGVVVAKLSAIKLARATGVLPENVNFAISEGATRGFLDAHDVPYDTSRSDKPKQTADIAASAKRFTVLIECWN